ICPLFDNVRNLLSSGAIPVIVFDGDTLAVRDAAEEPFIAISHVWADGLGSTTEVGLPTCQLERIAGYARQLVSNGAFWVDSLCVPETRDLRKAAIRLMAETYRRADAVVVFDAGIRQRCTAAAHLKETALWIATSGWMQRVWTLQEALLARELYFEAADGLLSMARLRGALDHANELVPSVLGPFPREPFTLMYSHPSLTRLIHRAVRRTSFQDVISLLKSRTTSKPEDESIAIAGLLGVDVAKLLAEEDADTRMRALFLELKTLPAGILFNGAPKLPFPGFRWAPRSLSAV
ncbi:hypothetical protein C8Q76DRAFT_571965, partial [Earliella scabrosa]